MLAKYFSVYDKKAVAFGQLFPSNTLGTAERSFKESVNNPDSPHSKHSGDFALYLILEIDDESGQVIQTFEPPQLVAEAATLVSPV